MIWMESIANRFCLLLWFLSHNPISRVTTWSHNPINKTTVITPPCLHQQRKEGSRRLLLLRTRIRCLKWEKDLPRVWGPQVDDFLLSRMSSVPFKNCLIQTKPYWTVASKPSIPLKIRAYFARSCSQSQSLNTSEAIILMVTSSSPLLQSIQRKNSTLSLSSNCPRSSISWIPKGSSMDWSTTNRYSRCPLCWMIAVKFVSPTWSN